MANIHEIVSSPASRAAQLLLGCRLVRSDELGVVSGIISEVEAYQQDDPASHTYSGRSERNRAMFGPPGRAYIYFSYGVHWCFNIVTDREGFGSGVLVRGVEIDKGLDIAWQRRYKEDMIENPQVTKLKNLSNGPGKVAQALAIDKSLYGINLLDEKSSLRLQLAQVPSRRRIIQSTRIGISKAVSTPWRWYLD